MFTYTNFGKSFENFRRHILETKVLTYTEVGQNYDNNHILEIFRTKIYSGDEIRGFKPRRLT